MGQAGKQKRKAAEGSNQAKPKTKLSPRDKALADVQGMSKRLTRLATKLTKLPPELALKAGGDSFPVKEGVNTMVEMFNDLAGQIKTLPDDWKSTNGKRGRPGLVVGVGDTVQIREKSAAKYADLFPAGTALTVTDVKLALVGVKMPSDAVTYVPKGHLVRVEAKATGGLAKACAEEE